MKRGIGPIPNELIYLVITALLVIAFFAFGLKLLQTAIGPAGEERGTAKNLELLAAQINALPDRGHCVVKKQPLPISIDDKAILVGFGIKQTELTDRCNFYGIGAGPEFNEQVQRPVECGNNACLCVFETADKSIIVESKNIQRDFDDPRVRKCIPLEGIDYVVMPTPTDTADDHHLVFTGGVPVEVSDQVPALQKVISAFIGFENTQIVKREFVFKEAIIYGKCHTRMGPGQFGLRSLGLEYHVSEKGESFAVISPLDALMFLERKADVTSLCAKVEA